MIYNSRIKIEIENTNDEKLISKIQSYWKVDDKGKYLFNVNEIGTSFSKKIKNHSKVQFDKGIFNEILVESSDRKELSNNIIIFNHQLEIEYENTGKKTLENDKTHRKDISDLFTKRKEKDIQSQTKLKSTYENNLDKQYRKLERLEFNCLLIIAYLYSKNEIVSVFSNKGFNWKSLNKLSSLGLLWMKRGFDNKIKEFIIHKPLRDRLISYIKNKGIDIYELEIHYM